MAEKVTADRYQDNSKLWDSPRFSDLLVKFHDRKIKAHRFVLCQSSDYFDKLCGPGSQFLEANTSEIELQDDDPDALEAVLRHLYNFRLKLPTLSPGNLDKVRYFCNVVVVSDKYGLPPLALEAQKGLATLITSLEDPELLFSSLKILTNEYSDHGSLAESATTLAKPRLPELALVADFPTWLMSQTILLRETIDHATEFQRTFEFLKPMEAWRCAFCKTVFLSPTQRKCCGNMPAVMGTQYVQGWVPGHCNRQAPRQQ